jgi:hypothetical protein
MKKRQRSFICALLGLLGWLALPSPTMAEQSQQPPEVVPERGDGPFDAVPEVLGGEERQNTPRLTDPAQVRPFDQDPFDDLVIPGYDTPEERDELAEELARRGQEALESHRDDEAARQLETSYRLVPQTSVLYPLARALEQIGRYAAASERLARYLDESPDLDDDQRYSLDREFQSLRRRFALVSMTTDPEGALLSIDGRPLGTSPLAQPLTLNHGHYLLEARLEGFRDAAQRIAVAGGDPLEIILELDPIRRDRSRGLEIALWITAGLAAASSIAWVTTSIVGARRAGEITLDPTPEEVDRIESISNASYGLSGATGALGMTAIVLAVVRAIRDGHETE